MELELLVGPGDNVLLLVREDERLRACVCEGRAGRRRSCALPTTGDSPTEGGVGEVCEGRGSCVVVDMDVV